ncbi:hypothetical protein Q8F55_007391 [Vanrija albida]|uniref:DUF1996 domain-containing protein n=1 Tax=Vanrija albida TaxID=181172 RepID=A0ABR3PTN7_9TREE
MGNNPWDVPTFFPGPLFLLGPPRKEDAGVGAGVSIWCFKRAGCQGSVDSYSTDWTTLKHGDTWEYPTYINPVNPFSCRFDTWGDWRGHLVIGVYGIAESKNRFQPVAPLQYSQGSGQYCVDMAPAPPNNPAGTQFPFYARAARW